MVGISNPRFYSKHPDIQPRAEKRSNSFITWSGGWELNPHHQFGRLRPYR
jgi:hypothetical protein